MSREQHVFIIGSKGIPAKYGGFETFVENLTAYRASERIRYHVACLGTEKQHYRHNGAECFVVPVPEIGPAKAVYCDLAALSAAIRYCREHREIHRPVFYLLACRVGPFLGRYAREIHRLGGTLFVNPDGHEWRRAKWSLPVRVYWRFSERLTVKHADRMICDSRHIEAYIQKCYRRFCPETEFIAYGSDPAPSLLDDDAPEFTGWLEEHGLQSGGYYLIVGRFVPENNFEVMIREFMKSKSERVLAIITTVDDDFLHRLERKLHFGRDGRIRFVGTVYDRELLKKIRENACGYLHGHEVGGTNPSLLEALGSTSVNLLLNVGFNREVAGSAALYWSKESGDLASLIDEADRMDAKERTALGRKARRRIEKLYSWPSVIEKYERLFLKNSVERGEACSHDE